jgi:predicted amidohydrolase YtcJ
VAGTETIYRARLIRTLDAAVPVATALWVRGDRIVAVGPAEDLIASAGTGVPVIDFEGATIVPGLIDPHCHVSMLAYLLGGADCSQPAASDIPAIQGRLAATDPGADGWVTGSGYAEYKLAERRHPCRRDLDEAVPNAPCAVYHTSLHLAVVNSAGLRALGLDETSPDPPQGWLGRDSEGKLDGRLRESIALDLLAANRKRALAALDAAGRAAVMRSAGEHLAALGLTAVGDAAGEAAAFGALREAERRSELPVRVTMLFTYPESGWLRSAGMTPGFGTDRLRIGGIKLWSDGGMNSRTAAVDEPYLDPPGETGLLWYSQEELSGMVRECVDAGFQVAIHAQGERGIRQSLRALAEVTPVGNPLRHRIEHGGCFTPELRREAARLGIHVVSQPGFFSALGDSYVQAFGTERTAGLYPFASMRDEGIRVAGSSDAPVITASPLIGMRDAILRRTDGGSFVARSEAVPAAEALEMYTTRAAFVDWADDATGSLSPGKLADFTVLAADPLSISPAAIDPGLVRGTYVGGQQTFPRD